MSMKKTVVSAAVGAVLSVGMAAVPLTASAAVVSFDWTGQFRMLDPNGAGVENSSKPNGKTGNNYQTTVTGTVDFDTITGAASATMVPFQFFGGDSTLPASAGAISFQAIGNGNCTTAGCDAGPLIMANMTFSWNTNFNIPVSLVLDASGMFGAMGDGTLFGPLGTPNISATVSGVGATPAADGTYVSATIGKAGSNAGYLSLGPTPIATTEWNTTASAACLAIAGCGFEGPGLTAGTTGGVAVSGVLDLVTDTATNTNEYTFGDGVGIGGNPMAAGPFGGFNANFDITDLKMTAVDPAGSIPVVGSVFQNSPPPVAAVPVPAAVWLFGSGLMGLVGVARRRKV